MAGEVSLEVRGTTSQGLSSGLFGSLPLASQQTRRKSIERVS